MKLLKTFFILSLAFTFFSSCKTQFNSEISDLNSKTQTSITIVNWNLQTFFDAETEGNEYQDFQSTAKWSKDKYIARLQRLCEVITTLNADIYVFEEVENPGVLYDISNQLAGSSWNQRKLWNYGAFAKEDDSCIGNAIISRFAINNIKTHNLDIRTQKTSQPSMRPILEASIQINNQELIILSNHWKSKSGGAEDSEIWRDYQEFMLANVIENITDQTGNGPILICGDFNRDIKAFTCDFSSQHENVYLKNKINNLDCVKVYSPWFTKSGDLCSGIGTYFFDKQWEFIDNFFSYGNIKITNFSVKADEPWANEDKTPNSFKIYSGEGYSDHLPIMCSALIYQE